MSLTGDHRQWFAVQTKVGREEYAGEHFARQGFKLYLPLIRQRCNQAGSIVWRRRPFFPGYLFLHLAMDERRWTTIRSTCGAIGAVRFGNHYPPVPEAMIEALHSLQDENGLIDPAQARREDPFRHGQKVRVLSGPMSDIEAIFQCMKGSDRVVVLMHLLGRRSKVELPLDQLA